MNKTIIELGFKSYFDYLKSDIWKNVKTIAISIHNKCKICHKVPIIFRHRAIDGIVNDAYVLIPLCEKHQYYRYFNNTWYRSSPYKIRDDILKNIGFQSYKEYLKSDIWKIIKDQAIIKFGIKCKICHNNTKIYHHTMYNEEVLSGNDISSLIPICNSHHYKIEFNNDKKYKKTHKTPIQHVNLKLFQSIKRKCRFCGRKMVKNNTCNICRKKHSIFLLDEESAYKHKVMLITELPLNERNVPSFRFDDNKTLSNLLDDVNKELKNENH